MNRYAVKLGGATLKVVEAPTEQAAIHLVWEELTGEQLPEDNGEVYRNGPAYRLEVGRDPEPVTLAEPGA